MCGARRIVHGGLLSPVLVLALVSPAGAQTDYDIELLQKDIRQIREGVVPKLAPYRIRDRDLYLEVDIGVLAEVFEWLASAERVVTFDAKSSGGHITEFFGDCDGYVEIDPPHRYGNGRTFYGSLALKVHGIDARGGRKLRTRIRFTGELITRMEIGVPCLAGWNEDFYPRASIHTDPMMVLEVDPDLGNHDLSVDLVLIPQQGEWAVVNLRIDPPKPGRGMPDDVWRDLLDALGSYRGLKIPLPLCRTVKDCGLAIPMVTTLGTLKLLGRQGCVELSVPGGSASGEPAKKRRLYSLQDMAVDSDVTSRGYAISVDVGRVAWGEWEDAPCPD